MGSVLGWIGLGFQVCGCDVQLSAGLGDEGVLGELQVDHGSLEQASKQGDVSKIFKNQKRSRSKLLSL